MISILNFLQGEKKAFTDSVSAFLPESVLIPFWQGNDSSCESVVSPGDMVQEGQMIARYNSSTDTSAELTVHSSIPGKVTEIVIGQLPNGKESLAARIRLQGSFTFRGKKSDTVDWKDCSPEFLKTVIAEKGIVNTFSVEHPSYLCTDISNHADKQNRLLIVRLYDEDPSCATDSSVAGIYYDEVVEGTAALAKAAKTAGIVFLHSVHAALQVQEKQELLNGIPVLHVTVNSRTYPCGFKRNLLSYIQNASKEEPFCNADLNDLYTDALTMIHMYNAAVYAKPVIDQYIHVTGNCVPATGLLKTCIGTSLGALAEQCGGFKSDPAKIIINGLFTGCAVNSLDIPVTKYVKSVEFMPAHQVPDQRQTTCIRCGKCRQICPQGLCPDILYMHISRAIDISDIYLKTAKYCLGCSLCNSVCSARLPLCQTIALLKGEKNE